MSCLIRDNLSANSNSLDSGLGLTVITLKKILEGLQVIAV